MRKNLKKENVKTAKYEVEKGDKSIEADISKGVSDAAEKIEAIAVLLNGDDVTDVLMGKDPKFKERLVKAANAFDNDDEKGVRKFIDHVTKLLGKGFEGRVTICAGSKKSVAKHARDIAKKAKEIAAEEAAAKFDDDDWKLLSEQIDEAAKARLEDERESYHKSGEAYHKRTYDKLHGEGRIGRDAKGRFAKVGKKGKGACKCKCKKEADYFDAENFDPEYVDRLMRRMAALDALFDLIKHFDL